MRFLTDDDYTHLAHPAIDALQALMPYDKETAKTSSRRYLVNWRIKTIMLSQGLQDMPIPM